MFQRITEIYHYLGDLLPEAEPWHGLARTAIVIAVFGSVVVALEIYYRRNLSRYRRKGFATDVVYSFFYQGGLYNLLIYIPVFGSLQQSLDFASLGLLESIPVVPGFILFWLVADFLGYWIHRLQHTSPLLWAFHRIHHAPEEITFLTSNRNHVFDQFIANAIMFVPILILGVPKTVWIPMLIAHSLLESLQHAALAWKFGPLYRVVVSPLFHNLHHSADENEYNGNYAKILSVWDFVFGTAVDRDELPRRYGIEGVQIPDSFRGQLLTPFVDIWRERIRTPKRVSPAS
ncbi:MAG: sterol desaturase family protein [Acidobacteria bacterium]|nr:sterol desaturase family protein [Acidobacteriota bacterium]